MEFETRFLENYFSKFRYKNMMGVVLIILLTSVLFSLIYWNKEFFLSSKLAVKAESLSSLNEFYRLLSSLFVHGDIKHLLSNSLMLSFLLFFVSGFFGKLQTYFLFCLGGVSTSYITLQFYDPKIYLIGASGSLFVLWGFWLVNYIGVETRYSLIVRVLRVIGVFLILLVPTSFDPNTSYLSHYVGFSLGVFYGGGYFLFHKKYFKSFEKWELVPVVDFENENLDLE